jgi:hypothetical protein
MASAGLEKDPRMMIRRCAVAVSLAAIAGGGVPARAAQPPVRHVQPHRADLFWDEKWHENAAGLDEAPIDMVASVRNPDLELKLYGPGARLLILGRDDEPDNKTRVYSGEAKSPMVVAWRNKKAFGDLTGLSRIRVSSIVSGLHRLYPTVKLANGDWYMADRGTSALTKDWVTEEIPLTEARWIKLDVANAVTKGNFVEKIDLSKVDEIGFTDLIPASGHGPGGWFLLGEVDVYGKAVPR